jgi:hypothetical protein
MMKLKLTKSREFKAKAELIGLVKSTYRPACEMFIPGIGRLRTSQVHSNFHLVESSPKDRVEATKTPAAKKPEVVYVR